MANPQPIEDDVCFFEQVYLSQHEACHGTSSEKNPETVNSKYRWPKLIPSTYVCSGGICNESNRIAKRSTCQKAPAASKPSNTHAEIQLKNLGIHWCSEGVGDHQIIINTAQFYGSLVQGWAHNQKDKIIEPFGVFENLMSGHFQIGLQSIFTISTPLAQLPALFFL